ncbi:L10-interacting MYB domain-containing protein-like [Cucumis melo var. makuwa]|uniref:L10-interacting MYB domain-containing protein-like n=2 Tax=Cucumis melo var. makuwa TaxID=1194695 RepID=A0A5D3CBK6_CUCMM|nr:L10-interacting MYB domain-containing protein-like [Cucumis melo var. makuwa]
MSNPVKSFIIMSMSMSMSYWTMIPLDYTVIKGGDPEGHPCVNACPSTRLISDFEDENENDVASNTNVGVEENDKGKGKKQVRRKKDKFSSFFSSFLDVYAENAKRKNDILEKRSLGCTSSQVDESQTSSKKDDLHKELMECLDILNTMEDVDGEAFSKILKLLHGDLAWRKLFLRMPN